MAKFDHLNAALAKVDWRGEQVAIVSGDPETVRDEVKEVTEDTTDKDPKK